jgi:DNA-binding XRE family transcriptional regulator
MAEPLVIEHEGKPTHVILPWAEWERIVDQLDVAHARRALADPNTEWVPAEVAWPIAEGVDSIRAWREYRGLSQQALAAKVGIDQAMVARWEAGRNLPRLPALRRLAAALGISVDTLIAGMDER